MINHCNQKTSLRGDRKTGNVRLVFSVVTLCRVVVVARITQTLTKNKTNVSIIVVGFYNFLKKSIGRGLPKKFLSNKVHREKNLRLLKYTTMENTPEHIY